MPHYLRPFTPAQLEAARIEVVRLVRNLQGRKLEEGDWTELYCRVKAATYTGWSNLPFRDYLHNGVGVEFKLLMRTSPQDDIGRSLMHPAATRTIDFDETDPPDKAMRAVLKQWSDQIEGFEQRIAKTLKSGSVDAHWGVLLWAQDHSQFLYFEERLKKPNPADYFAAWGTGTHRGKKSRNLHIFEGATKRKRFSCTVPRNGAKLQPYFDVPSEAQGAVLFKVPPHTVAPVYVERDDIERMRKMFPGATDEDVVAKLLAFYLERNR